MRIKLGEYAYKPQRAHNTDAGLDLYSPVHTYVLAGSNKAIRTGVYIELPKRTCGLIFPKSGLYMNHGIVSFGLIDEGYTGEIIVNLTNLSNKDYLVSQGEKISQLVVLPCLYVDCKIVDKLLPTDRGENGHGSTGRF